MPPKIIGKGKYTGGGEYGGFELDKEQEKARKEAEKAFKVRLKEDRKQAAKNTEERNKQRKKRNEANVAELRRLTAEGADEEKILRARVKVDKQVLAERKIAGKKEEESKKTLKGKLKEQVKKKKADVAAIGLGVLSDSPALMLGAKFLMDKSKAKKEAKEKAAQDSVDAGEKEMELRKKDLKKAGVEKKESAIGEQEEEKKTVLEGGGGGLALSEKFEERLFNILEGMGKVLTTQSDDDERGRLAQIEKDRESKGIVGGGAAAGGGGGGPVGKFAGKVAAGAGKVGGTLGKLFGKAAAGVLAAFVKVFGNASMIQSSAVFAVVMPLIGLGVAGFIAALALGMAAVAKLAAWSLDALSKSFPPFAESLKSFEDVDSNKLSSVAIGIADFISALPGPFTIVSIPEGLGSFADDLVKFNDVNSDKLSKIGPAVKALGEGLKNAGLGALFGSIAKAFGGDGIDVQMAKMAEGFRKFDGINVDAMTKIGPAAKALGEGLSAMGSGDLKSAVGGLVSAFGGLFGIEGEDPIENIKKFAVLGEGETGAGLASAGEALSNLGKGLTALNDLDVDKMSELANTILPEITKLAGTLGEGAYTEGSLADIIDSMIGLKDLEETKLDYNGIAAGLKSLGKGFENFADYIDDDEVDTLVKFAGAMRGFSGLANMEEPKHIGREDGQTAGEAADVAGFDKAADSASRDFGQRPKSKRVWVKENPNRRGRKASKTSLDVGYRRYRSQWRIANPKGLDRPETPGVIAPKTPAAFEIFGEERDVNAEKAAAPVVVINNTTPAAAPAPSGGGGDTSIFVSPEVRNNDPAIKVQANNNMRGAA